MSLLCELEYFSVNHHLAQLYTGFALLARSGLITLKQRYRPQNNAGDGRSWVALRATVNGDRRIFYDVHDSDQIRPSDLDECVLYFKRSLRRHRVPKRHDRTDKVRPLGLYYPVYPDRMDRRAAERALRCAGFRHGWHHFLALLPILDHLRFVPRLRHLQPGSLVGKEPRALFLTRAWDPYDRPGRDPEDLERIRLLNETRANCIRALRAEFGYRVLAGFSPGTFALKHYPQELAADPSTTKKGNYIRLLRSFPIGIATTGLNGSVGAKMGEYVATGRAIVAERNDILLRGGFLPRKHFLPFSSPEACVENVALLFSRPGLVTAMGIENCKYYQAELRPDVLVRKTLLEVMALGDRPATSDSAAPSQPS